MGSLFVKECKAVGKSIVYLIFVAVVILFYITQLQDGFVSDNIKGYENPSAASQTVHGNVFAPPQLGQENYGFENAEIPEQVMPGAVAKLVEEYGDNLYTTYPVGFVKHVRLHDEEQTKIVDILEAITGQKVGDLQKTLTEIHIKKAKQARLQQGTEIPFIMYNPLDYQEHFASLVSYDAFKNYMSEVDAILGGGSSYASGSLVKFGQRAISYEEALAEHNLLFEKDKITGAFARYFCDYMGIVLALFSVFVPVAFTLRDKKANMQELIYSRRVSSAKLLVVRYFAVVLLLLLPILILSLLPTVLLVLFGMQHSFATNPFAFIQYILVWLLPVVLTTTAVGMFFTILTDTPLGIAVQFLYSFLDVHTNVRFMRGGRYGSEFAIRHNTIGNYAAMQKDSTALVANRLGYTIFSLVLLGVCIWLYELKRRGKLDVGGKLQKIRLHCKGAAKADAVA